MEEVMKTIDEEERKNAMYLRLLSCLLRKSTSTVTKHSSTRFIEGLTRFISAR